MHAGQGRGWPEDAPCVPDFPFPARESGLPRSLEQYVHAAPVQCSLAWSGTDWAGALPWDGAVCSTGSATAGDAVAGAAGNERVAARLPRPPEAPTTLDPETFEERRPGLLPQLSPPEAREANTAAERADVTPLQAAKPEATGTDSRATAVCAVAGTAVSERRPARLPRPPETPSWGAAADRERRPGLLPRPPEHATLGGEQLGTEDDQDDTEADRRELLAQVVASFAGLGITGAPQFLDLEG